MNEVTEKQVGPSISSSSSLTSSISSSSGLTSSEWPESSRIPNYNLFILRSPDSTTAFWTACCLIIFRDLGKILGLKFSYL